MFVEHPHVPMDNNAAERALRALAVARKNFYGSRSQWSGELAMGCFTILATLRQHGICPRRYFRAYLEACARAGRQSSGQPGGVPALELERGKEGGLEHAGAGAMSAEGARRYCGREFSPAELDHIRGVAGAQTGSGASGLVAPDLSGLGMAQRAGPAQGDELPSSPAPDGEGWAHWTCLRP